MEKVLEDKLWDILSSCCGRHLKKCITDYKAVDYAEQHYKEKRLLARKLAQFINENFKEYRDGSNKS